MSWRKLLFTSVSVVALVSLGVGCRAEATSVETIGTPLPSQRIISEGVNFQASHSQAGVNMIGVGVLEVEADLAIFDISIESRSKTVTSARRDAAVAMTRVRESLLRSGLRGSDIQTSHFSIQPEYVWGKVVVDEETGAKRNQSVLVGYIVRNSVIARVRQPELDEIGGIIDDVSVAGGDLIRVNGIRFTVEDPSEYRVQAREMAVKDAMVKARQMAEWAGATLGNLIYLTELNSNAFADPYARGAMAMEMMEGASTPIDAGELEIRVEVQARWGIQ